MNSDIANTLGMLRQRIRKLQQMEQMLIEEFGDAPTPITRATEHSTTASGDGNGNGHGDLNRKNQLMKFLKENGPSKRGVINEKSGIPKGTIANLLTKSGFVRREGKWHVDPSSATQETTH
jgi:hypothetical protein